MARYLKLGRLKNIFAPTPTLQATESGTAPKYQNPGPTRRIDSP